MKTITISTDCSGIDAPIEALKQLKIPFKQIWYCDVDKFSRETSIANHPKPDIIFEDILKRDNKTLPHVDLYVCGFPCQSFSSAGKRLGMNDPRSKVITKMIETISYSKPKICILENVRGFVSIDKGVPYNKLLVELKKQNYSVYPDLYNTKNYGIPQNRERIYIVAIRNDYIKKQYKKPEYKPMKPFEKIVIDKTIVKTTLPDRYKMNLHKLKPFTKIITPRLYYSPMEHVSPTLDSRCRDFYLVKYNRLITEKEALLLQGFPKNFKQVVSSTQFMKQLGNTMSVNVLKEIIKNSLECI